MVQHGAQSSLANGRKFRQSTSQNLDKTTNVSLIIATFCLGYIFIWYSRHLITFDIQTLRKLQIALIFTATANQHFSMVVASHSKRNKELKRFLTYTLTQPAPSLAEIIISWGSELPLIQEIVNEFTPLAKTANISLGFEIDIDKSVNRRFSPAHSIKTSCLLSIDDDILMNPGSMEFGFQIWRKHPKQLVGFSARYIRFQRGPNGTILQYSLVGRVRRLILTGIAFMSKELAFHYYAPFNKVNTELVKSLNNCEDILMNFVAMNLTHLPAVHVKRLYKHIGLSGLYARPDHGYKRQLCLNTFYSFFKELPLIISSEFVFR